ncbi:hypothetical protein [Microbacterium sp. NPDC077486]|uniref:hypothetical protein n=1 Tax=Microbacterium sp. NPDC077486 TaxID=3154766 RepID=UPI00342B877F
MTKKNRRDRVDVELTRKLSRRRQQAQLDAVAPVEDRRRLSALTMARSTIRRLAKEDPQLAW